MIKVENITKIYRPDTLPVKALDGITVSIKRGEYVAIMGPSGSGKSTFMNILSCLDKPTSGSYWLDGEEISQVTADELAFIRNQKIGFVFQNFNLLPRMTALRNVELPMLYAGVNKQKRRELAREALEKVGMLDRLDHRPAELSGGQNQRVAIARALVNHPKVLLADEPTGNLDSRTSEEIMDIFTQLHAENTTIVLVTHEAHIAHYSQRIIHFYDGLIEREELTSPWPAKNEGGGHNEYN